MDEKSSNSKGSKFLSSLRQAVSGMPTGKKIKLLLLIIVLIVLAVVYINYTSVSSGTSSSGKSNSTPTTSGSTYYISSLEYCNKLEQKLKSVLSSYNGISNVEVMITLDSSMELILAESSEAKNSAVVSGMVEVSSPILIDTVSGEAPLVVKEILPQIKGVLIVCTGATVADRLAITQAVQSLLNINVSKIQVLSGN